MSDGVTDANKEVKDANKECERISNFTQETYQGVVSFLQDRLATLESQNKNLKEMTTETIEKLESSLAYVKGQLANSERFRNNQKDSLGKYQEQIKRLETNVENGLTAQLAMKKMAEHADSVARELREDRDDALKLCRKLENEIQEIHEDKTGREKVLGEQLLGMTALRQRENEQHDAERQAWENERQSAGRMWESERATYNHDRAKYASTLKIYFDAKEEAEKELREISALYESSKLEVEGFRDSHKRLHVEVGNLREKLTAFRRFTNFPDYAEPTLANIEQSCAEFAKSQPASNEVEARLARLEHYVKNNQGKDMD